MIYTSLSTLTPQTTRLVELHILADRNNSMNVSSIKTIIACYESSLEQLTLNIHTHRRMIDGQLLQTLVQPCQNLKNLAFVFQYRGTENDVIEQMQQFKSDWWLDARRSPVLILRNNGGYILLSSMPCHFFISYDFSIDSQTWRTNKEPLDSPFIHFTKVRSINIENTYEQPVTLETLCIIGHIFESYPQRLTLDNYNFASSQSLFEQVSFCCYLKL